MGALHETLVLLVYYHREWSEAQLQVIFNICALSLNPPIPPSKLEDSVSYACEGILVLQAALLSI